MIGLETNVLARYFVAEENSDPATDAQREAARTLIESGQPLYVPKTLVLELEWMLRGYYGFAPGDVAAVLEQLLSYPSITMEDRPSIQQALAGLLAGLDFADARHHASCRRCDAVASFDDRGFGRRIKALNLPPRVFMPTR